MSIFGLCFACPEEYAFRPQQVQVRIGRRRCAGV